jgi:hypothetical protein
MNANCEKGMSSLAGASSPWPSPPFRMEERVADVHSLEILRIDKGDRQSLRQRSKANADESRREQFS